MSDTREHPSEAEPVRPPQQWRDRHGVVWCLDDDPDLAWRDSVRACDSPTRTRHWVTENLGPLEPIAEGVQPTAREHPGEAQVPAKCPCRTWAGLDLADWPEGGHHRLCDGQGGRRYAALQRRAEPYRVGSHNPRNIYRSGVDRDTDEQVAVAFTPEMGRLIVVALNALAGGPDDPDADGEPYGVPWVFLPTEAPDA